MQYIFILLSALFFLGCSPKYKTVSEYVSPPTEEGKECLSECQKQYGSCKEICEANFEICKVKAAKVAKENYDKKMHEYVILLEQYVDQMRMYDLERDLYYFGGYYGYGYGYGNFGYYNPYQMFWAYPSTLYRPLPPIKPSLNQEIKLAEKQMCQVDCCTKTFDECYVRCGGVIKDKEVCVKNCPKDEK